MIVVKDRVTADDLAGNQMISFTDQICQIRQRTFRSYALVALWITAPLAKADELHDRFEAIRTVNSVFDSDRGPFPQRSPTLFKWSGQASISVDPDSAMATDRPDVTEASSTVGAGVLQIETGYTYVRDSNDGNLNQSHSLPEALFRYGTPIDCLELRFATNASHQNSHAGSSTGVEDIYLGAKLGLTLQDGLYPEMAVIPQMTIPSGASAFTSNKILPGLNWLYGWDVTEGISTAGSSQFNFAVEDQSSDDYTEWTQTWTVGYALHDQIGAYTEWFAFFPHGSDSARTEHYANCGLTFAATDDLQFDIRTGMGLNDAAADWFTGIGMAIRFR